jgi:hypothetical protein
MVEGAIMLVTHRTHRVFQSARVIRVRKNMNDLNSQLAGRSPHVPSIAIPAI